MNRRLKRIEMVKNKTGHAAVVEKIRSLLKDQKYIPANDLINSLLNENPNDDVALALSARIAFDLDKGDFGASQAQKAIEINSMNDEAYALLGKYYYDKQMYDEAKNCYLKANRINDSNPEVVIGMTNICLVFHKDDEALLFGESAVYLDPDNPLANMAYADILRQKNRFEEAETYYRKAMHLDTKLPSSFLGLGIILYSMGRYEEAVDVYRRIPKDNLSDKIKWNMSLAYLSTGRWQMGYRYYLTGFSEKTRTPNRMTSIQKPMWKGEDLSDKTIMIWREQGVGDEILFSYYYNEVIRRAKKVIIECEKRLIPIFKQSFPAAEVRPQSMSMETIAQDGYVTYREVREDYDYHIPAMQLPQFLYNNPKDIPIAEKSVFSIRDEVSQKWKQRVSELPGLKVGIIWRGGNVIRTRSLQYFSVSDMSRIFSVKGVTFVNLMYAECAEEKQYIKDNYGVSLVEWDDLNLKDDFEDVMALTANLDLVIGAGTCTSNIAGMMMTPTVIFSAIRPWTLYGGNKFHMMPNTVNLVKEKWNGDNSELDVKIAAIIERFKETGKIQL